MGRHPICGPLSALGHHIHRQESLRPHFSMDELNRTTPVRKVEGCPLLSRQVEARDAVWIADEVVQSRRRSCQPIVFPAGPEPGLLRHAGGRQIAEMMGLLEEGAT